MGNHMRNATGNVRSTSTPRLMKSPALFERELEDVERKLDRFWHFIETSDIETAKASARIREHLDRQERLQGEAADARAILSQRSTVLDDVETTAAYAQDVSEFLKEIVVMPGYALLRYTIPMPGDSSIPGRSGEEFALNGSVLSTRRQGWPPATTGPWNARPTSCAPAGSRRKWIGTKSWQSDPFPEVVENDVRNLAPTGLLQDSLSAHA